MLDCQVMYVKQIIADWDFSIIWDRVCLQVKATPPEQMVTVHMEEASSVAVSTTVGAMPLTPAISIPELAETSPADNKDSEAEKSKQRKEFAEYIAKNVDCAFRIGYPVLLAIYIGFRCDRAKGTVFGESALL